MTPSYPLLLDLSGRRAVVVGGGPVAARRARGLVDAGARVEVIAPWACEEVWQLHDAGSLAPVVSIGRGADQHGQALNFGIMDHLGFDPYEAAAAGFGGNGVSLTLGLQHQQQQYHGHGGVNVAAFAAASPSASTAHGGAAEYLFMAGDQQLGGGVHSSNSGQYGAGMPSDADAAASQQYHRGLSATGFHLLRDLAG
jgi:hypothetical protein